MFIKECKAILKSIIYFAFVLAVILFYATQLGNFAGDDIRDFNAPASQRSFNPLIAPEPGQDSYGYRPAEVPEQVMPKAIWRLLSEYVHNEFSSWATGFYRSKRLNENQLAEIHSLFIQMTGLPPDELAYLFQERMNQSQGTVFFNDMDFTNAIPLIVEYDEFKEIMTRVDNMIGGGSYYDPENLKQYGRAAVTFEERLAEYEELMYEDGITGAYARLFSDYMGIVIALFSVAVPVSFLLRDKQAKINELIFSRAKSSANIVMTRYFALVFMTTLPFILLSLIPTVQLSLFAARNNMSADYFAFIKYIAAWLLPSVLIITSTAFLFTTLTDTPIAILFQAVWSFVGIFTRAYSLAGGNYGFEIAIRHNSLGNLHLVRENINALIINRASYTAISIILILVTIYLFSLKRRGRFNVRDIVKRNFRRG